MKVEQHSSKLTKGLWNWPIETQQYDQTYQLSPVECSVIESYISSINTPEQTVSIHANIDLRRLHQPIHAALGVTKAAPSTSRAVVRLLLSEMHQRQATFWAWSNADWITILHKDSSVLRAPPNLPGDCRQHLIAIAYLLCDFVAIDELGTLSRASLSKKVFRAELLELAFKG